MINLEVIKKAIVSSSSLLQNGCCPSFNQSYKKFEAISDPVFMTASHVTNLLLKTLSRVLTPTLFQCL